MLVEIEFQYRLAEVNPHLLQMNALSETVIVAAALLSAGLYLGRRFLLPRRGKSASPCGAGACGCPTSKSKIQP